MVSYFPIVTGSLTVLGNISVSGSITTSGSITISGSITSASFATSASNATNAISASYANNLTVAGTLTAQTLVVQTITSSVSTITGSTNFGSLSSNTHVFTGSMYVTGAFYVTTGSVGIGTTSPSQKVEIQAGANQWATRFVGANVASQSYGFYVDAGTNATDTNAMFRSNGGSSVYMYIGGDGKIGVGTSSPSQLLDIVGTTPMINIQAGANTNGRGIQFNYNGSFLAGSLINYGATGETALSGGNTGTSGYFLTLKTDGAERMRIASNGLVSINNTVASSNYKLGVSGSAYINGTNNKGIFVTDGASYASIVGLNSAISTYNNLELRASGTDGQLFLNTSGNVLVGTITDRGAKFVVEGTDNNNYIMAYNTTSNSSVRIQSNQTINYLVSAGSNMLDVQVNGGHIMRFINSGGVSIGTQTDYGYKLNLNGQPGCNGYTAWTNWSDSRLKENITDLDATNVLNKICTIRPVTYNYNELSGFDEATRSRRISGFIAQELMEVFPDMVGTITKDDNEYYDTNLSNLNLYLVKAIQELNTKFEEYKATHP